LKEQHKKNNMTIQELKNTQTTLHQAINQAYQRGVFSLDDSINITNALSELATFISAIEKQEAEREYATYFGSGVD
jgi:uncharacterized protein (DUF2342 family)